MKKKILSVLLCAAMVVSMTACGLKAPAESGDSNAAGTEAQKQTEAAGDKAEAPADAITLVYAEVNPLDTIVGKTAVAFKEKEVMADMVEALGASAWKITYGEVYASLERGTVDGAENNWPSYVSMMHDEVAKYWTTDEHTRVPEMQLCSVHTWEKLTEEQQQIILECAKESALYERELWTEREADSREEAVAGGVQVVELSAEEKQRFQDAMMGVYEKYCGEYMDIIDQIIAVGK